MAKGRQEIDLVVNALVKGFDALESDLNQTGESFGKLALKQQLAADKSSLFDKQMRELTKAVADGKITIEDAANRAENLAKKLQLGGEVVQKQKLSWTDLKSALDLAKQGFEIVAKAAEFAYTNIKEGAQLELARGQFDNLTASIGTTSDSMLNDLRAATKGMQSDAELIAGATDIISLGLSDTQEGTVRLATAVSTLGLDMQQVILTFANNSKARLDALGLSIEDVDAKTQELEANGFQGDAFDEAVLMALEEKMTLLGDASETTAGSLQILESDWANLTNELKQGAAEIAGPVVSAIVANRKEAALLKDAYEKGLITYMEYQKGVSATSERVKTARQVLEEHNIVLSETGEIIGTITEDGIKYNAMMEKQTAATSASTSAYVQQDAVLRAVKSSMLDFGGSLGPTTQELEEMAYASGEASSSKEQLADGIDRAKAALEAEAKAVEDAAKAEEAAAAAAKAHAASMGDLFTSAIEGKDGIGLFNETAGEMADRSVYVSNLTRDQRDALSDLQSEYEKAQETINDYTIGAKGVGLTTEEVNEKVAAQQEIMAGLQGAMDPLLAAGGEYVEVQGSMTINQDALNQSIYDAADSQGASAEQLAILGGALGLYSDEAVEAALKSAAIQAKIDELAQAYVDGKIGVDDMRVGIQDFISSLDDTSGSISETGAEIDAVTDKMLNLPDSHTFTLRFDQQGSIPNLPTSGGTVGGGGYTPQAFATGTGGWVTVPGPVGSAVPITVHGGETMNVVPAGQSAGGGFGGGVTQNNYFANPTNPNAIATATAEKLGQAK